MLLKMKLYENDIYLEDYILDRKGICMFVRIYVYKFCRDYIY